MINVLERKGLLTLGEVLKELEIIAATKGEEGINLGFSTPCAPDKFGSFKIWANWLKSSL
jgi:hypothetical protein